MEIGPDKIFVLTWHLIMLLIEQLPKSVSHAIPLLSPLSLGAHSLANRFVLSPMTTHLNRSRSHWLKKTQPTTAQSAPCKSPPSYHA